jgi:hypothetical protein
MKRSWSRVIPMVWVAGLCAAAATATAADYTVTHGRQVIINRGIQIQSVVLGNDGVHSYPNFTDLTLWRSAGFTTFNFFNQPDSGGTVLSQLKPLGQQWGKIWGDPPPSPWPNTCSPPAGAPPLDAADNWGLSGFEHDDVANLADLQWSDERRDQTMAHLCSIASLFRIWNQQFPQALAHTNFCETPGCSNPLVDDDLTTYVQQTQPDILTFDQYPPFSPGASDYNAWYAAMQKYRLHALAGYTTASGANSGPLPYGQYMRTFRGSYTAETANESFINLQHFASLAFGYTWVSSFIYTAYTPAGQPLYPVLFESGGDGPSPAGDQHPNSTVFGFEQHANSQTMNLSNYFKRAVSTGIFYMTDSSGSVTPANMFDWTAKSGAISGVADDYITSITPYTGATANGGVAADSYAHAIVGYFMPLQYLHDYGRAFVNGLHFMIVNGSAGGNGTADDHGQWYHVVFDFTGTSDNSLLRLNRTSGQVELVPLVSMGNNQYYLDLYLPGGVGDVFAFWNSSLPVPGMRDKPISIVPIVTTLLQ